MSRKKAAADWSDTAADWGDITAAARDSAATWSFQSLVDNYGLSEVDTVIDQVRVDAVKYVASQRTIHEDLRTMKLRIAKMESEMDAFQKCLADCYSPWSCSLC